MQTSGLKPGLNSSTGSKGIDPDVACVFLLLLFLVLLCGSVLTSVFNSDEWASVQTWTKGYATLETEMVCIGGSFNSVL